MDPELGGNYPFSDGLLAFWDDLIWTPSGVVDVSSPENSFFLAPYSSYNRQHVSYRGRFYSVGWNGINVWDAAGGVIASNTAMIPDQYNSNIMFVQGTTLFVGGNHVDGPNWIFDLNKIDLADPDAPVWVSRESFPNASNAVRQGGVSNSANGGVMAAEGANFYAVFNGVLRSQLGTPLDSSAQGDGILFDATTLRTGGPWVFAAGHQIALVAHAGHVIPNSMAQISGQIKVTADHRYIYVCRQDIGLSVYDKKWNLVTSSSEPQCNGQIDARFPFVWVNGERFQVSGSQIVKAAQAFCETNTSNMMGSCDVRPLGLGYDYNFRYWLMPERALTLDQSDCQIVAADEDRLYCVRPSVDKVVMGTTFTNLRYSGIVTGPLSLPLRTLVSDGTSLVSAGDGFLSTGFATYRVRNLGDVRAVGPANLMMIGGRMAADNQGNLYSLTDEAVYPVARVPMDNTNSFTLTPDGTLVAGGNNTHAVTQWGPAAPELRFIEDNITQVTAMATAGGYVYVADNAGVARLRPLKIAATLTQRPDITVRHHGSEWMILNRSGVPITTVTAPATATVSDLCGTLLQHEWSDPNQFTPITITNVCDAVAGPLLANRVLEGDLGDTWLAYTGADRANIGAVSAMVDDGRGTIYAASGSRVFVFSSGENVMAGTALPDHGVALTSLAVTNQWLLATDQNGAVARYDLSANPITGETLPMIQDFSGRVVRQIRAGGGKAAAILHDFGGGGTDLLALIDPQAGTISSTGCQNAGQVIPSFALFEQRWAGRLHPMAIVVSSNGWQNNMLSSISLEDCATAPSWQPLNSINSTVAVDNGLLFLGYGVNGVSMLSMADLSTASMSTRFVGTEGAKFAKILGGFVYTSGENGTQIFQMH